eukprot:TRINITY_DN2296_c1_g1_i2.p1 TRINITY_DN2296_c1_g1~~TRINITY_DN2296_c1_g1_i2.p1  ORF type:complete len:152 (-),score=45.99 TRINITY_DN2296_c1_g1_i2:101-556(-)
MASLTVKQQQNLHSCFSLFDKDGDGRITASEFPQVLRALGLVLTEGEIRDLLREVDPRRTGSVGLQDVTNIIARPRRKENVAESLRAAFQVFDTRGTGTLTGLEVRKILSTYGEEMEDEDIEDLIREVGLTPEGKVNYERLIYMISSNMTK